MKQRIQGIIIGAVMAVLLTGITALAWIGTENIPVTYSDIKLVIDDVPVIPKDPNGNIVEPFIYNGTTYLPVRAVGEAFGKQVDWDGETGTVYVGGRVAKLLMEIPLYNKSYLEVENSGGFKAEGNDTANTITISGNASNGLPNYVVYPINRTVAKFRATLMPGKNDLFKSYYSELLYKIYGDGTLLYTSPFITPNVMPIPIEIDVSKYLQLKIEGPGTIQNAVIVTTEY